MDKNTLQKLTTLLMSNKFDPEAYKKLPIDECYALFRLAAIHHSKLTQTAKGRTLNAKDKAAHEHALKVFLGKAHYFYALAIDCLKKLDCFYVAHSALTNMPYAFCDPKTFSDMIWIFTTEEKFNAVAEKQKEQNVPLKCVRVDNKDFLNFFVSLFFTGIDHILMDYSTDGMMFTLENICRKPDFEKMDNPVTALHNPSLCLSALYFLQEARKKTEHQKGTEHQEKKDLPELEEEMTKNVVSGSYLMPFIKTEPSENAPSQFQIPYLKGAGDSLNLPVFTDLFQFQKYNQENKYNALPVAFNKLSGFLGKASGVVINPMGFCLLLPKNILPVLASRFEED